MGNNNSLSPRRFEHLKKLEKSKTKQKKRSGLDQETMLVCFLCLFYLWLFSRLLRGGGGGGIGAQKVDVS